MKPCGLSNFTASTALNCITHSKSIPDTICLVYAAKLKIAQLRLKIKNLIAGILDILKIEF
jgi:hypothetical protein